MYAEERRHQILALLRRHRRVAVARLADSMGISPETVRRDLREMEQGGLLKRTHGGAIPPDEWQHGETPYLVRKRKNLSDKRVIARRAADMVGDGDLIAIDNSSTAACLLEFLPRARSLTILTNSIQLAMDFTGIECGWECVTLGGMISLHSNSTVGSLARQALTQFRPDKLFMSCAGVEADGQMTEGNLDDTEIKKALIDRSKVRILLADASKFGRVSAVNVANAADFDYLVTTSSVPADTMPFVRKGRVRVLWADRAAEKAGE